MGDPTIALCIDGDGSSTPNTEVVAEALCNAPAWTLCTAEEFRARNDACDYAALTFSGVVAGGGNDCIVANTSDQPGIFDCASDFVHEGVAGGCGGPTSADAWGLQEWSEPSGGGVGGAVCCLK